MKCPWCIAEINSLEIHFCPELPDIIMPVGQWELQAQQFKRFLKPSLGTSWPIDPVRLERDRYREALERIAAISTDEGPTSTFPPAPIMKHIAKNALGIDVEPPVEDVSEKAAKLKKIKDNEKLAMDMFEDWRDNYAPEFLRELLADAVMNFKPAPSAMPPHFAESANEMPLIDPDKGGEPYEELSKQFKASYSPAGAPAGQMPLRPTNAQVFDACLSYRHDFGLMSDEGRRNVKVEARAWQYAWHKTILNGPSAAAIKMMQEIEDAPVGDESEDHH